MSNFVLVKMSYSQEGADAFCMIGRVEVETLVDFIDFELRSGDDALGLLITVVGGFIVQPG